MMLEVEQSIVFKFKGSNPGVIVIKNTAVI
jgi:hypothetical protein